MRLIAGGRKGSKKSGKVLASNENHFRKKPDGGKNLFPHKKSVRKKYKSFIHWLKKIARCLYIERNCSSFRVSSFETKVSTHSCCTYLNVDESSGRTHYVANQLVVRFRRHRRESYQYFLRGNWNIERPPGTLSFPALLSRRPASLCTASKSHRALEREKLHHGRYLKKKIEQFNWKSCEHLSRSASRGFNCWKEN